MTNYPHLGFVDYFLIDNKVLQITSGGINEIKNFAISGGINGYGGAPDRQKAFQVNYQSDKTNYTADVAGNVFRGETGDCSAAFRKILTHTIDDEERRNSITVAHYAGRATLPNDDGKCLVSNLSLNFSAGQMVSYSAQFKSTGQKTGAVPNVSGGSYVGEERPEEISMTYGFEKTDTYPPYVINDNYSPLGWHGVTFDIEGIPSSVINSNNIISFNVNIDNSTYVEHTFNGERDIAFRVSQGKMVVSGKLTYAISVGRDDGLAAYDPFKLTVNMADITLVFPHCFVKPDPVVNSGANAFITRSATLNMFAGDNYEASVYEA